MTTGFQGFRYCVIYLSLVLSSILVLNFSAFFVCFFFSRKHTQHFPYSVRLRSFAVLIIPSPTVLLTTHFLSKQIDSRKCSKSV